jgi:hypothetical protein
MRAQVKRLYRILPEVVRSHLKSSIGFLLFRSRLYRFFVRGKALIVLFHRVDDHLGLARDTLSCTRSEFAAYCAFFQRYFEVIPLETLLDHLAAGENLSRKLVITFDDGYKDNHDVAAPELASRGLPACFFVATNFIGSDAIPWWDADASITPAWMSWNDVRSLVDQGFEIGAHTMNHVDLGEVSGEPATAEIVGSGERLEREVGVTTRYFSYPYGRAHQLSEPNRLAVQASGYRCCLAAHGGAVGAKTDPFRMDRLPVSPATSSPYSLGFEALRQRVAGE